MRSPEGGTEASKALLALYTHGLRVALHWPEGGLALALAVTHPMRSGVEFFPCGIGAAL